jgi:hypothetical protein
MNTLVAVVLVGAMLLALRRRPLTPGAPWMPRWPSAPAGAAGAATQVALAALSASGLRSRGDSRPDSSRGREAR